MPYIRPVLTSSASVWGFCSARVRPSSPAAASAWCPCNTPVFRAAPPSAARRNNPELGRWSPDGSPACGWTKVQRTRVKVHSQPIRLSKGCTAGIYSRTPTILSLFLFVSEACFLSLKHRHLQTTPEHLMSRDKYLDQVVLVGSKKSIQSKDNATAFIIEIPCIEKPTFSLNAL